MLSSSNSTKGKLLRRLTLYSSDALTLLEQAMDKARAEHDNTCRSVSSISDLPRYHDSSDEEKDEGGESSSSSSDEADDKSAPQESTSSAALSSLALQDEESNISDASHQQQRRRKEEKPTMDAKQRQATILRHAENLSCVVLPCDDTTAIYVPSSLLPKEDRLSGRTAVMAEAAANIATLLAPDSNDNSGGDFVVILCLRSGRFAGAVYQNDKCVDHTTAQRYTVRKGQGKAQSTQDGNRRPKSMGAQLRRAGEQLLQQDVLKTLQRWQGYITQSALILISCPKTMMKDLVDGQVLLKTDKRIRRVPLDVGRPSFEAVGIIHAVLTCITLREYIPREEEQENDVVSHDQLGTKVAPNSDTPTIALDQDLEEPDAEPEVPLSPLHLAARDGELGVLKGLLQSEHVRDWIDMLAGEDLMTPLHYAAQAVDASVAANCVYELVLAGRANPCLVDARNRVPWFLAETDKVREAFRKARADLGENYCDWDAGAKVAAPMTEEDIQRKKDVEAEKRRKKRARQKQKKAEEKAIDDARAQQQRDEAEQQKQEEDAKRIRDSLQPKSNTATNVCDYCQTTKKGLRRKDMFKRLDYVYCSTDCVQKHKRELMAVAALKRLEG